MTVCKHKRKCHDGEKHKRKRHGAYEYKRNAMVVRECELREYKTCESHGGHMNYLKKIIAGVGRWRTLPVFVLIWAMILPISGCGGSGEELRGTIEQGQELLGELSALMEDARNLIGDVADAVNSPDGMVDAGEILDRDGSYTSKADVALYIHTYGELPGNFMTKKEAEALGWSGGSLGKYAEGMSIGGDRFGNYEGILPKTKGRTYKECDIDTLGKKSRGAKRIVFSNDGLVYYTEDHYESFELLYGEE